MGHRSEILNVRGAEMRTVVADHLPVKSLIQTAVASAIRSLSEIPVRASTLGLDASFNCISAIDASIPINSGLRCLFLNDNMIDDIPEGEMAAYSNLTVLDISRNLITKIQNLAKLSRLIAVDLSGNRISVLENLEALHSLQFLFLSGNRIHSIFLTDPLPSLIHLNMSFNFIQNFEVFRVFPNLTTLELNHCFVSSLRCFRSLPRLKNLSLSYNQICDDFVLDLPALVSLDISHNFLRTLEFLENLVLLESLDVSYNPIDDDGVFVDFVLRKLCYLNVSGTKLTKAPSLQFAPNLQNCLFANTQIVDISLFLRSQRQLIELDLRGTAATAGLYFDSRDYESIEEYDRTYPENAAKRHEFRASVLQRNPKLVKLDGILTRSETVTHSSTELTSTSKHAKSTSRPEYLKSSSIANQIKLPCAAKQIALSAETRQIGLSSAPKQITLAPPPKCQERHVELEIDKMERESQKSTRRSRQYVYERCSAAIFRFAALSIKQKLVLEFGGDEFRIVQAFISSKCPNKIELVSGIRNDGFRKFAGMQEKLNWLCLVVDDGIESARSFEQEIGQPVVVADHMNHLMAKLEKSGDATFMICAFDNGKTAVDRNADVRKVPTGFDSVLFQVGPDQFFYAMNQERILPIYLVKIRVWRGKD
jgi:Leucine-rich repeat (LRR) protein